MTDALPAEPDHWHLPTLVDLIADGLKQEAAARDAAGDFCGLDGLNELNLHPLVAASLAAAGYGVWPEQRYPADRIFLRRNSGRRCDLVLTPPGRSLAALEGPMGQPLLPLGTTRAAALSRPIPLQEAYWLEVKTVAQHTAGAASGDYTSRLLRETLTDVRKMSTEPSLLHCGLLVLLFTADAETALHDLEVMRSRCIDRDLPVQAPERNGFKINDRLGNSHATVTLLPVWASPPGFREERSWSR